MVGINEQCYFCSETRSERLEKHHIVPRRYGGSDSEDNLVLLCANCHKAIEALYDDSFFRKVREKITTRKNNVPEEFQYHDRDYTCLDCGCRFVTWDLIQSELQEECCVKCGTNRVHTFKNSNDKDTRAGRGLDPVKLKGILRTPVEVS